MSTWVQLHWNWNTIYISSNYEKFTSVIYLATKMLVIHFTFELMHEIKPMQKKKMWRLFAKGDFKSVGLHTLLTESSLVVSPLNLYLIRPLPSELGAVNSRFLASSILVTVWKNNIWKCSALWIDSLNHVLINSIYIFTSFELFIAFFLSSKCNQASGA